MPLTSDIDLASAWLEEALARGVELDGMAADTYFNEALDRAQGLQPLSDFVMQNRT